MLYDKLKFVPEGIDPKKTTKALFVSHNEDFGKYFRSVSDDIQKSAIKVQGKVSIWYFEDIEGIGEFSEEELSSIFMQISFVTVPVTRLLLTTKNTAFDIFISYARLHHIPVLPLMQESGLEELYSDENKFGSLQFLDKSKTDITAISFEKKLEDYLSYTVIGNDTRKKVEKEFQAYIFLSYRKKDRAMAGKVMSGIHSIDEFRDIAIWYDEFLVPGEDFNSSISTALSKGEVFVMAVTPNITEAGNYIILHEYPAAIRLKRKIVPVECEATDKESLTEAFEGIPECVRLCDITALKNEIGERLSGAPAKEDTPEHLYLMGLAYLSGIDMEIDYNKALSLLISAAEKGSKDAMNRLHSIYRTGQGVPIDYEKSLMWLQRLTSAYEECYSNDPEKYASELFGVLANTVIFIIQSGLRWSRAEEEALKAYSFYKNNMSLIDNEKYLFSFVTVCILLHSSRINKQFEDGSLFGAIEKLETATTELLTEAENAVINSGTDENTRDNMLFHIYNAFGETFGITGETDKAEKYRQKIIDICIKQGGETEVAQLLSCAPEKFTDIISLCKYYLKFLDIAEEQNSADKITFCHTICANFQTLLVPLLLAADNIKNNEEEAALKKLLLKILYFFREIPSEKHTNSSLKGYNAYLTFLITLTDTNEESRKLLEEGCQVILTLKRNLYSEEAVSLTVENRLSLAEILVRENNLEKAAECIRQAESEVREASNHFGNEFIKIKTCELYEAYITVFLKTADKEKLVITLSTLCSMYYELYNSTKNAQYKTQLMFTSLKYGVILDDSGRTEDAIRLLISTVDLHIDFLTNKTDSYCKEKRGLIFENLKDVYYYLGQFCFKAEDTENARHYCESFLDLAEAFETDETELLDAYTVLLKILTGEDEPDGDKLLSYTEKSAEICKRLICDKSCSLSENIVFTAFIIMDLAEIVAERDIKKAVSLLDTASDILYYILSVAGKENEKETKKYIRLVDKMKKKIQQ